MFALAQEADESLQQVRRFVRQKINPTQNDLQGLPCLGWQLYNQLGSLFFKAVFHCRKLEPTDGRSA